MAATFKWYEDAREAFYPWSLGNPPSDFYRGTLPADSNLLRVISHVTFAGSAFGAAAGSVYIPVPVMVLFAVSTMRGEFAEKNLLQTQGVMVPVYVRPLGVSDPAHQYFTWAGPHFDLDTDARASASPAGQPALNVQYSWAVHPLTGSGTNPSSIGPDVTVVSNGLLLGSRPE